MMKRILAFAMIGMVVASCSDNNDMPGEEDGQSSAFEADYIGKAVGNFTAEEWYPGGQLGWPGQGGPHPGDDAPESYA